MKDTFITYLEQRISVLNAEIAELKKEKLEASWIGKEREIRMNIAQKEAVVEEVKLILKDVSNLE